MSLEVVFPPKVDRFLNGPVLVKGLTKTQNQGSYESRGKVEFGSVPWTSCSDVEIHIDKRIVEGEKLIRESQKEGLSSHQMLGLMAQRMRQDLESTSSEDWSIEDWK